MDLSHGVVFLEDALPEGKYQTEIFQVQLSCRLLVGVIAIIRTAGSSLKRNGRDQPEGGLIPG